MGQPVVNQEKIFMWWARAGQKLWQPLMHLLFFLRALWRSGANVNNFNPYPSSSNFHGGHAGQNTFYRSPDYQPPSYQQRSGPYQPSADWTQNTYQPKYLNRPPDHPYQPPGYVAPPNLNLSWCNTTQKLYTMGGAAVGGAGGAATGAILCAPVVPAYPACLAAFVGAGAVGGAAVGQGHAFNSPSCQDVVTRGNHDTCNGSNHYCPDRR